MTTPVPDSLVILLHGVGAFGYDLAPLGEAWRTALPRTAFAAPDAPSAFDQGQGRQWFSIKAVTPANRPERVAAARPAFDAVLTSIIADHGFGGRLDRVALVGFSQGAIMALDALASGRWPAPGIVGLSGRLATPAPLNPARATPLLLVHGGADPVIPPAETIQAATTLRAAGVAVESHVLPGVGHVVAPEAAGLAARFLAAVLGPAAS